MGDDCMKFCYNCGTQLEDAARFCINCGSSQEITQKQSVETEQPVLVEEPVAAPTVITEQPIYTQPVSISYVEETPKYSTAAKVFGIVSMACGIAALALSIIFFFMGCSFADYAYEEEVIVAMVYMFMFMAAGIVGLIFSSKATAGGNTTVMPRLGKIFSIISLPTFGLAFLLFCIALS